MESITLPIWALAATVGVPGISLLWIIVVLIRRRRKALRTLKEVRKSPPTALQPQGQSQFMDDLLALQIDIVFNGLAALIETERVKLNTLLNQRPSHGDPIQQTIPAHESLASNQPDVSIDAEATGFPVGRKVAEAIASGLGVDDVASELGLSHAEVTLAMKLNQLQTDAPHRKLKAVA